MTALAKATPEGDSPGPRWAGRPPAEGNQWQST